MPRKFRFISALAAALIVLSGCQSALIDIRNENKERERRIAQKEQELQDIERQNIALEQERTELLSTLNDSQLQINTLSEKLTRLREENARFAAENEAQKRKQNEIEAHLKSFQDEIDKTNNSPLMTREQKLARIEQLKDEIRIYLELGLR